MKTGPKEKKKNLVEANKQRAMQEYIGPIIYQSVMLCYVSSETFLKG